jgi:sugar O-acyltransferase (sialic acid O-acetyltransferase NeuD family)
LFVISDIILVGAGGHARSCVEVIESAGLQVLGFVDRAEFVGRHVLGYPILGSDDDLPKLLKSGVGALVAVGQIGSPKTRIVLYERLAALGAERPVIAAKSACISRHAQVGAGTVVMHGAIINAAAAVGENVIVNSRALIEHDASIGDHCHISIGSIVGGGTKVGRGCFIGGGAMIGHDISIGAGSIVGAGCVILEDCPAQTFVKSRA